VREFIAYAGLADYVGLRSVARSHVIHWRKDMEKRALSPATSKFDCELTSYCAQAKSDACSQNRAQPALHEDHGQ
jgi:hypothetical protein